MEAMFAPAQKPPKLNTPLPPTRRIITGHDDDGQTFFEDDRLLEPYSPRRIGLLTASLPPSPTFSRHQIHHPPPSDTDKTVANGSGGNNSGDGKNLSGPGTPFSEGAQIALQELGDALPRDGRMPAPEGSFINLFLTEGFPAAVQGPWTEYNGRVMPVVDSVGTTLRMVDIPPGCSSPMHRSQSVDFTIVLKGQIVLELDAGERTVKEGDVVVQRGTMHAWHNRTSAMVRMAVVLVPAEAPVVNGETLEPCGFDLLQRGRFDEFQF